MFDEQIKGLPEEIVNPTESIEEFTFEDRVALIQRDPAAWEKMVKLYSFELRLVAGVIHSFNNADDITQVGFLKAFNNIEQYNPSLPLYPWLRRIVANSSIDEYRKQKRNPSICESDINQGEKSFTIDQLFIQQNGINPEEIALQDLDKEELYRALEKIRPDYKETLLLRLAGHSLEEIHHMKGWNISTIKTYIFRGKQQLKKLLMDNNPANLANNKELSSEALQPFDAAIILLVRQILSRHQTDSLSLEDLDELEDRCRDYFPEKQNVREGILYVLQNFSSFHHRPLSNIQLYGDMINRNHMVRIPHGKETRSVPTLNRNLLTTEHLIFGKSVRQLAEDYQIDRSIVSFWISEYRIDRKSKSTYNNLELQQAYETLCQDKTVSWEFVAYEMGWQSDRAAEMAIKTYCEKFHLPLPLRRARNSQHKIVDEPILLQYLSATYTNEEFNTAKDILRILSSTMPKSSYVQDWTDNRTILVDILRAYRSGARSATILKLLREKYDQGLPPSVQAFDQLISRLKSQGLNEFFPQRPNNPKLA